MRSSLFLVPLYPALCAAANDWVFGKNFALGPTADGIYIAKATWSLKPPAVPCGGFTEDKNDPMWMSIWIGVGHGFSNQNACFFQPLLNWQEDQEATGCPAASYEWCVAASTYVASRQLAEPYTAVPSGATLDFEVDVDSSMNVVQRVWVNGKLTSQRSDTDGSIPTVFYSGNECYKGTCGTLDAYTWFGITVVLSAPDETFGNTLDTGHGAALSSGIYTSDNGQTWYINWVAIAKDYFYIDGSKRECSA